MKLNFKSIFLLGSSFAAGACAYAVFRYWKKRQFKSIDEGFEDVSRIEDSHVRRILMLGLQGAGKTTILKQLTEFSDSTESSKGLSPTTGFLVSTMERSGVTLNIWEVGGGENSKPYWANFYEGTDLLVFVVDSADLHALSLAVRDVSGMLADPRLAHVPVVLVAHKQDLPGALSPKEVADALDIGHAHHPVTVLGTSAPPTASVRHPSLLELERALLRLALD